MKHVSTDKYPRQEIIYKSSIAVNIASVFVVALATFAVTNWYLSDPGVVSIPSSDQAQPVLAGGTGGAGLQSINSNPPSGISGEQLREILVEVIPKTPTPFIRVTATPNPLTTLPPCWDKNVKFGEACIPPMVRPTAIPPVELPWCSQYTSVYANKPCRKDFETGFWE